MREDDPSARDEPSDRRAAASNVAQWFAAHVPKAWFAEPPEVDYDRDEILVVGTLPEPEAGEGERHEAPHERACLARISTFREETRQARVRIADEAERRFGRKVAWGARCGDHEELFTTLSVPVMTRLRMSDRRVLDTLVDAGVARSRSHALAWCVRLVQEHQGEWITQLRDALVHVQKVRDEGPKPA